MVQRVLLLVEPAQVDGEDMHTSSTGAPTVSGGLVVWKVLGNGGPHPEYGIMHDSLMQPTGGTIWR